MVEIELSVPFSPHFANTFSVICNSMKISIQIIFLLLIIISCKSEKQKTIEKNIIGDWNLQESQNLENKAENKAENKDEDIIEFISILKGGFIFENNGIVINKPGYFKFISGKTRKENQTIYLGDSTTYKIENDSLKILNLENKLWDKFKVISISKDTLKIQTKNKILKFSKLKNKVNPNEKYDEIIISSSGCYGTCPIFSLLISRNGRVLFFGEEFNLKNGLYSSKIDLKTFEKIENNFKKANIQNLEPFYSADWTDDNTITVSFIRNGKIVKTISDYGNKSPNDFRLAYTNAQYLYQIIKLNKIETDIPLHLDLLKSKRDSTILNRSESFHLSYLLINKGKIKENFDAKYILKPMFYKESNVNSIRTDGRYFETNDSVLDLGFNFIEKYNLKIK